jgi:hypothetical protein
MVIQFKEDSDQIVRITIEIIGRNEIGKFWNNAGVEQYVCTEPRLVQASE